MVTYFYGINVIYCFTLKLMNRKIKIGIIVLFTSFLGLGAAVYSNDKLFEIVKNIEIYTKVFRELNTYYVDEIDPSTLMKTGIDAMMNSLDPYTVYWSESQIEYWKYMTDGKYEGIGAVIRTVGKDITVMELYDECPAQEAGLKAGDVIRAIDGKSMEGKKGEDMSLYLRGVPGTKVVLTIERPGTPGTKDFTISRGEIKLSNTPYSGMITPEIGYISLITFTKDAGRNVANALKEMKDKNPGMKGVILDLRDNGGGLLNEAVNVTNVFVPKGLDIVSTRGKVKEWDRSFKTTNTPTDEKIPLVVLINKFSASASEIVSGALQDLDRGVLIGQRSYGKGLVQNTKETGYNSMIKLTTSKYYIPSGRCIQSVSYKNGEPVDIPDVQRNKFKTNGGRTVLDGGGVTPDIKIDLHSGETAIRSLMDSFVIFKYGTQYALKHQTIAEPKSFTFSDFDDFIKYVESAAYPFVTKTESNLNELEKNSKEDEYYKTIKDNINTMRSELKSEKRTILLNHKDELNKLIAKDIVTRYYFQKGKIINGIQNDEEVKEAIKLLGDAAEYKKLLSK